MQRTTSGTNLFSASDLVNFLECEHKTNLDLINLEFKLPKAKDDDQAKLIQDRGFAHEADFLEKLKSDGSQLIDIAKVADSISDRFQATLKAMKEGVEIIYQATFLEGPFMGYADFLRRVPKSSNLGDYSYEVMDTKLARSVKAKFVIQLSFYSDLLTKIQGTEPEHMVVVLGNGKEVGLRYSNYSHYYARLKSRFLEKTRAPLSVTSSDTLHQLPTYPSPCTHCSQCHWRDICTNQWVKDDHLSLVANIRKGQIKKLNEAGIFTLEALGETASSVKVPKISGDVFRRLQHQARLQLHSRRSGQGIVELIEPEPTQPNAPKLSETGPRGFELLPEPDPGDLYFDMEGNPLEDGGLEYLFGLYYFENGKGVFKPFWAHDRKQEGVAFSEFMGFVSQHLAKHPKAHIYHYAPYEVTALKKLMGLHGVHESSVDNLLRHQKMVDLYRVVRESIRVSEPAYSIKNLEHFYMEKREGDVTNAGASIVYYENWKKTKDPALLQSIEDYNKDDVISTFKLRDWLITLRPKSLAWFASPGSHNSSGEPPPPNEADERLKVYQQRLVPNLPDDPILWTSEDQHRLLTFQLLDFHRRKNKPEWWGVFDRQAMSQEERLEASEAIAGMTEMHCPPKQEGTKVLYTFKYPEQEFKVKTGDSCALIDSMDPVSDLVVNEAEGWVSFKLKNSIDISNQIVDIGLKSIMVDEPLKKSLFRYADNVVDQASGSAGKYPALDAFLKKELPAIQGVTPGSPIVRDATQLGQVIQAVHNLQSSYLFIQGPPGAGKTYTGSHLIVSLLKAGKRVGVSSNSHKAIINLLQAVEDLAIKEGVSFKGVKKSSKIDDGSQVKGKMIVDVSDNDKARSPIYQLVAGTAWLFADPDLDQSLDYFFVDEAGQVALGMLVPMAMSAKNLILLGDQMQLSQPTQGVHPGDSGLSTLDFLLKDKATIPPERGIFLNTTWRMHPDVCQFISEAVYEGRLKPEPKNAQRYLILNKTSDSALKPTGISFASVTSEGCSQWSPVEVLKVKVIFENLLTQHFHDEDGKVHRINEENILVVSPYNMQVNKLTSALPEGARVGTVDKFQGQEAEVVIISMATSSHEDLPRNIEFLYSKNRLNVAISRAKCLAVLVANPKLLEIPCNTPEQMGLVNTLCWAANS